MMLNDFGQKVEHTYYNNTGYQENLMAKAEVQTLEINNPDTSMKISMIFPAKTENADEDGIRKDIRMILEGALYEQMNQYTQ